MTYYVTADSFGDELPANWEEIAAYLNALTDERGIAEDHDACNDLWEEYWNGELKDAPVADTTFYAVQVGSNNDLDFGSYSWSEAKKMAQEAADDPDNDGLEIRIVTIERDGSVKAYCSDEDIIREGSI